MKNYKVFKGMLVIYLLFTLGINAVNNNEKRTQHENWIMPKSSLRYDQVSFLTSHNAFANKHEGWNYGMQLWNLKEQLAHGVRGFMLDIYPQGDSILECHVSCNQWKMVAQKSLPYAVLAKIGLGDTSQKVSTFLGYHLFKNLKTSLSEINDWLEQHPAEVVTIFFENYVPLQMLDTYVKSHQIYQKTLTPTDWDLKSNNGNWPTLDWLKNKGKRVIFFIENKACKWNEAKGEEITGMKETLCPQTTPQNINQFFAFMLWENVIESQYGTLSLEKVCVERPESAIAISTTPRRLYLLNYFPKYHNLQWHSLVKNVADKQHYTETLTPEEIPFFTSSSERNSKIRISAVINYCYNKKLAAGKMPNFIALDFVDEGNALAIINEINKKA